MDIDRWRKLIDSPEASDRSEAADVLPDGDITPDIVAQLLKVLADEDALARTCAADTLGDLPSESVRAALRARLEIEDDSLTRAYLLSSLGSMGNPEDAHLLNAALRPASDPMIRTHAAYGLLLSTMPPALQAIIDVCQGSDDKARSKAFGQLSQVTELFRAWTEAVATVATERQNHAASEVERQNIRSLLERYPDAGAHDDHT